MTENHLIATVPEIGPKEIDQAGKQKVQKHYDKLAGKRARFRKMNRYYYKELLRHLSRLIPPEKKVLEVGCGDGYLLKKLAPRLGVGIDLSEEMIKTAKLPLGITEIDADIFEFLLRDVESLQLDQTFDYILCSDVLGDLFDIQKAFECLRKNCDMETRLILQYHSVYWEPILKLVQKMGLKSPQLNHNWMTKEDIENLLTLADFQTVSFDRKILIPVWIPLVSIWVNRLVASLPGIRNLCLSHIIVARKKERVVPKIYSTTIVIPCRNEKGTIRAAVERLPEFGSDQEIIFVDGHSTDGTADEIKTLMRDMPERNIRFFPQEGKGKGDAVRLAFKAATKDILMILDADLSVPPEDLPKFYNAIASHKAEFINGSRLVYPMEQQAMRFLNILGNHFFSGALTWLLNQPLKDTLCGTKVLFRKDYEKINAGRIFFGDFDPFGDFDLLFGAVRQNLKILEIPVRYRDRTYGTTNISRFKHGFLLLKMVGFGFLKLKW